MSGRAILSWIMFGTVSWVLIFGLWDHDWRMITASIVVGVIWTLLCDDIVADDPYDDLDDLDFYRWDWEQRRRQEEDSPS